MTIAKSKILSNDQLWDLIDQANWQTDHDYARINHAFRAFLTLLTNTHYYF